MNFPSQDLKTLLSAYVHANITHGSVTGTFQKWEQVIQASTLAEGYIVEITDSTHIMIYVTSGTWNGSNIFTGQTSTAFATASAVDFIQPSIRFNYEDQPVTHQTEGYVEILTERLNTVGLMKFHKDETYRIPTKVFFDVPYGDSPSLDGLLNLYKLVKYSLERGNRETPRSYIWSSTYIWNGLARLGSLDLFVDAQRIWVNT